MDTDKTILIFFFLKFMKHRKQKEKKCYQVDISCIIIYVYNTFNIERNFVFAFVYLIIKKTINESSFALWLGF